MYRWKIVPAFVFFKLQGPEWPAGICLLSSNLQSIYILELQTTSCLWMFGDFQSFPV